MEPIVVSNASTNRAQTIKDIEELDYEKGIEYCGEEDDYLFALKTYAESVGEKVAQLEACMRESRFEDCALLIHSLKSMSKSIGAIVLSDQAKDLELAARNGDAESLKNGMDDFLRRYRALGKKLSEIT